MDLKNALVGWIKKAGRQIRELNDHPRAIAMGVAVGIFFGFTPLFGLKTLLAIAFAWLLGGNKIAAAVTVTLHDVFLPLYPVILRTEYDIGFWLLSHPHVLPPHLHLHPHKIGIEGWLKWSTFFTVGRPLLLGSVIFATPISIATYFIAYAILRKVPHQNQK